MASHSLPIRLVLLAALVAVFSHPAPAQSDPVTPTRTLEGIAATQDGKPLARATLYLFSLPPGLTDMITLGDQSTVVTDDQGHFIWPVPAALPPLSAYIGVRSIECYALAADCGATRFRLAVRPNWHGTDAEGAARGLLEQATRPCETKWLLGGAHPVFSVVVPDTSAVLLAVRGPDGQPLRARVVQFVRVEMPMDYKGAIVYTSKTDAGGRLRLRCFSGSFCLQVFVPGLGFGSTGMFDAAGQLAAPALPPLAPFARLSGTVTPAVAGSGAVISLDHTTSNESNWYDPRAVVDAGGRWTLADVLPGQHRLLLAGGRGEIEPVWVTVQPGEQVGGITIGPKKPLSGREALIDSLLRRPWPPANTLPDAAPSVRGRVTDADGKPVAGADVYAVCDYPGGMGIRQKVLAAKTDAAGAYLLSGLPTSNGQTGVFDIEPSVHLVAHLAGFGLAVADAQNEKRSEKRQGPSEWNDQDLVLPASHAALTVRVLRDGKPAPNVVVALAAQGENSVIPALYHESDRGEAAQALRALLSPSAQTGLDGVARFTNLTPGLWDVSANRSPYPDLLSEKPAPPFNASAGVIVQAGKDQSYTVSLLPPPGQVAFHVVDPGGLPFAVPPTALRVTTASDPNYGSVPLTPDGAGIGRGKFYAPGLYQVTVRAGDRPLDINVLSGPYSEGTALIAVSPATVTSRPITIPTRRIGPASIRVLLRDAQGKPLRGAVTVGDQSHHAHYAASADASGVVVFPNMPLNFFKYIVTARFTGRPVTAALSQIGGPFPSDADLLAGISQPLPQAVVVRGGEETLVTFGTQPPGYVRLRLTGPLASASGYFAEGRLPTEEALHDTRYDPTTGEYLFGPLPAGPRTLRLFRYVGGKVATNLKAGQTTVTVKAGQIVHATLTAQSTAAQEALYSSPLSGTVYLTDGKTPAWGARAALFLPNRLVPLRMARTNTQGHLTLKDFWRSKARIRDFTTGASMKPVLVAWLPGENGAVLVPFQPGQDARLVLPAPISLHGRVTVSGKTVGGLPSLFRVRVAYQGQGKMTEALADALSVEATAQADGTFTLGGLTPGTYQVQAARDGIWLSGTQTVTVSTQDLPELTLDIAPPGVPVILRLEDRQGKPQTGQEVRIARPNGPLTGEIWPALLTSDGAGILRVDGLEAGHHLMTIPGRTGESIGFDVPAWTPTAPTTVPRIVVSAKPDSTPSR